MLSQRDKTGTSHVIAFASRSLQPSEQSMHNYSSAKLELLALKWLVTEKFRDYLLGSRFTVYTDNNPLAYVKESKLGAAQIRWLSKQAYVFRTFCQLCKTTPVSYTQTVIPLINLVQFLIPWFSSIKSVGGSTLGDRTPTNSKGVCVTCNVTTCRKFSLICECMWYLHVKYVLICVNNMCNMCNYVHIYAYVGQICIIMHFQYYKCINKHII